MLTCQALYFDGTVDRLDDLSYRIQCLFQCFPLPKQQTQLPVALQVTGTGQNEVARTRQTH